MLLIITDGRQKVGIKTVKVLVYHELIFFQVAELNFYDLQFMPE